MHRVLNKNGRCPGEEISMRRKYSKEVTVAKVESYYCEQCGVQILDHENIMKHVGTHIEFCTGRASKYGRDKDLWLLLESKHLEQQGVPPDENGNTGNIAIPQTHEIQGNYTWETLEQHFWGILDNTEQHVGGDVRTSRTMDHVNSEPSAAICSSSSSSRGSAGRNTGVVAWCESALPC